ncbi:MAG: ATP synthase F1 subunit epsilon [Sumerlaeia bacterium]
MAEFRVQIVTAQQTVFDEQVTALTVPGSEGSFGVLAHHADIVAVLKAGNLVIRRGNIEVKTPISEGFLEMSNNVATVLADGLENLQSLAPLRTKVSKVEE